jgi:two-component system nitrate/nitrite response regulator NarL
VIRVLLVDDHDSFRQPLAFMLEAEPDITVVGQAASLAAACRLVDDPGLAVDVATVDLVLADGDGVELIRHIRDTRRPVAVLVVTAVGSRRELGRAVEAGADGVLHKSAGVQEVIDAVRRLSAGEALLPPHEIIDLLRLAARERQRGLHEREALARLTGRELDVLRTLVRASNDRDIAALLNVKHETVRTHMANILGKLGVDSRVQAVVIAVRHGVIELD